MHEDAIAVLLRADAERLLAEAPAPDAARTWHAIRAARAARLNRFVSLCGWSLRAGLLLLLAVAAALAPSTTALGLVPAIALIGWLTGGICTSKGIAQ